MPRRLPKYLPADWPDYAEIPSEAEWQRAQEEERIADEVFKKLSERPHSQRPTPKSIAAGERAMTEAFAQAAEATANRIANKELLRADEFCEALGVTRDWLSDALTEGRLFALEGPEGRSFFPSFYADPTIQRGDVERVVKILSPLHPGSQYWFFATRRTSLQATPLEALRAGRLDAVSGAAERCVADTPKPVPSVVDVIVGQSGSTTVPPAHNPSDSFADVINGVKRR